MKNIVKTIITKILNALIGSGAISADELTISSRMVGFIQSLWEYFAIVGVGFSIIYFLMEINRKYAFEASDMTIKSVSVPFLKFVAAVGVLSQGGKIIGAIVEFGNTFITWAEDYTPADGVIDSLSSDVEDLVLAHFADVGFFLALIIILPALLTWLVTLICQLVWKYKALGYKIELLFRIGISPIALADVYSGQNSQAIRWCKAMLATVLYGASFIIVVKIGHAVALNDLAAKFETDLADIGDAVENIWDVFTAMLGLVVVPIAELGVISAIRSALKEALA